MSQKELVSGDSCDLNEGLELASSLDADGKTVVRESLMVLV